MDELRQNTTPLILFVNWPKRRITVLFLSDRSLKSLEGKHQPPVR